MKILPVFLSVVFSLLFSIPACTSVGSRREAPPADSPDAAMAPPAAPAESGPKDAQKPQVQGLPEAVLPDGILPLEYEKLPDIPLLDVSPRDVAAAVPLLGREVWYGVYVMNQKVGAMSSAWTVRDADGKRLVEQKQTFRMEMNVLGGKKTLDLVTTVTYDAQTGDLLEHFTVQKADHLERTVRLVRRPDGSHAAAVEDKAPGQKPSPAREYVPNRPLGGLSESDLAFSVMLQKGPSAWNPGKAWRARKFMSTDISVAHEAGRVVASVQREVDGRMRTYHLVETVSDNPKSRVVSVYDDQGGLVVSRVGTIEMRLEDARSVREGMGGRIDTGIDAIIPVRIENPRQLAQLVLQMDGPFAVPEFLNEARYRLETVDGKKRLTLTADSVKGWEKPNPAKLPETVRKYLGPEPNIESDDPEIVAMARQAAGKFYQPVDVIRAVVDFVGDTVQDTMRSDIDSARMVARMKKGDCTEHSILATALLRALGYPARQVGGVGFVKMCNSPQDCLEGLGYHAWTQVWVGRWVDVDPTWKQTPADVTHVLMGTTADMQWLESLGKLKVTVIESK